MIARRRAADSVSVLPMAGSEFDLPTAASEQILLVVCTLCAESFISEVRTVALRGDSASESVLLLCARSAASLRC
jgi:hypothetical protein